jgi:hypothetical protein
MRELKTKLLSVLNPETGEYEEIDVLRGKGYWTEKDKESIIQEIISSLADPSEAIVIPSYWKSYLAAKVIEIDNALVTAGNDKSAFLWYTDAHWATNYKQSPMLLKYLSRNTNINKTFFGGDVAVEASGEINSLIEWQNMIKSIPNHHSVIGNHDNHVSELPTAAERADFFFNPELTGDMVRGTDATNGKMYYYIDNYIENTRYICLSTGRMYTWTDEVQWCINALNSTPENWHIVIISHLWIDNDYEASPVVPKDSPEEYTQIYLNLFDAYNSRESGVTSMHSINYNFSEAKAKVEFIIGGHVHQDYDFTTAKEIPVILTESDAWQERDDISVATKGTTTENCVYAIVADYSTKKVKVINIGRGETRNLTIPELSSNVTTFTNQLSISIDASGNIYNSKGYKENYRINSSGAEASYDGRCVTGFIPVRPNDIIRFKNMDYMNMSATSDDGTIKIALYDASFKYVNNASHHPNGLPSTAWAPVYREDGNVKQLKIPTAYGDNIYYMRVSAKNIDSTSIITVNEEIE